MDANISCNVTDLFGRDRESLEHLLGTPLNELQKICIVAFTPGKEPDAAVRGQAADRIEQLLDCAAEHARRHGVTESQMDAAVDEAMGQIRRRKST